ncbi:hypothetical protein Y032_0471g2058 [Ancylostoma ceylanicum]|uniref:Uncharacterized protein n=1 Tax=Ancylostoma ceylanicum TaxID=53326 RepID=A0A016WYR6_9BILA|nr:hypothetical protein Y032_0471g2058 [Ancylostoma ceylanicum]
MSTWVLVSAAPANAVDRACGAWPSTVDVVLRMECVPSIRVSWRDVRARYQRTTRPRLRRDFISCLLAYSALVYHCL